ncbi:hypothetical protein KI387_021037, partial [Taxus chinensis]
MARQILKLSPLLKNCRHKFVLLPINPRWNNNGRHFASRTTAEESAETLSEGFHNEAKSVLRKSEASGLYGFDVLKTAKGFQTFVQEAIERSGELIAYIKHLPPSVETIHAMDEISDTICTVVDSAELCRNTHPDRSGNRHISQVILCPRANLDVLDKLIATRHDLAQILGYKSYAEFAHTSTMASSPAVVMSFLHDISKMVKNKADEELHSISEFKKQISDNANGSVEPWDEAYYTGMMKASACNLESTAIASYFPLSQCLEGLTLVVRSLFGASFDSVPLAPGESWHPNVQKLILHHPIEGDLGCMYLDLYVRKDKYPGCAHFAIKGGRRLSETEYQLPVVALVCNFPPPARSSQALLNHWEVETLFHEFGHAIHSLLSRTDYQHFSGTRTVLDFAETPANLFEYFAWDHRVLKQFAKTLLNRGCDTRGIGLIYEQSKKNVCSNRLAAS